MTSLIYQNSETTLWFVPAAAAQAADYAFEMHNIAAAAGRQSAAWDRGVAATPAIYEWCAFIQFAETPVLGETIDFYLKPMGSDASATAHPANDDGTGSIAVSAVDKLNNLHYLGSIVVDEVAVDIEMVARDSCYLTARGYNIVMWNASADALTNDVDENGFFMTPIPDQGQDT